LSVILVHGMFVGTGCWEPVAQRLREHGIAARMVQLHPTGATKSGRGFRAVMASVRKQVCDFAGKRCVLVGHSLGAQVVERLLPEFPLATSILVNPSPNWGRFGPIYPLWVAARRGRFWRGTFSLSRSECQRLLFQGMSAAELEEALRFVEPESGELVRQAFWFFDLFGAATRIPRRAPADMRVITGALDPMATPAYCAWLARAYGSEGNLDVLDGVGHMGILQERGVHVIAENIARACNT
jgi:pimeloyl-ACP methyl ester carboxylesterase